jgi:hypothetical protein
VERVVFNALAKYPRKLSRLTFAPAATVFAIVFGEADPPTIWQIFVFGES